MTPKTSVKHTQSVGWDNHSWIEATLKHAWYSKQLKVSAASEWANERLTVKTFSGCPRARMFVSWICLRIIQASSCFPTWKDKTQNISERLSGFSGNRSARWQTPTSTATMGPKESRQTHVISFKDSHIHCSQAVSSDVHWV